jgi:nicotinamide-nucleotide amidase
MSTLLSQVPGASQSFRGSIICYHTDIKKELGVPEQTISSSGVVSAACAEDLAAAVADKLGADIGLSVTGVAGPASQEGKPIGLIYIGLYMDGHKTSFESRLGGTRTTIQLRASKLALFHAIRSLRGTNLPVLEESYPNKTE